MSNARSLGGMQVSPIGLGCMSFSGAFGAATVEQSNATLKRALELGVTFFDTANAYGAGENERIVGKALGPDRNKVSISTKFGLL